jgi:hypothetical protein
MWVGSFTCPNAGTGLPNAQHFSASSQPGFSIAVALAVFLEQLLRDLLHRGEHGRIAATHRNLCLAG